MSEKELAQALYQAGLLTQEQIQAAAAQRTPESSFSDVIIRNGWVTQEQINQVSGSQSATAWGTVSPTQTPPVNAPPPYTAPPYSPPIPAPTGFAPGARGQATLGGGSATSMPPSPRPGMVSTDAINEAWALLKPNIGVWLAAIVITLVIGGIVGQMQQSMTPHGPDGRPHPNPVSGVFSLISIIVTQLVTAGLLKMALQNIRTGRAELSEMFNIGDVIVNVVIATILTFIVVVIGFVFCIIPGIILALGLSMTQILIVDQKMDAVTAMKASWEGMKGRKGALFVLGFVLLLLNIVGLLALCVGYLVTLALTHLTLAVVYRDVFYGTSPVPLQNPS